MSRAFCKAVGEVHHGDETGGFRRTRHLVRLGVVFRERLFAHDMFASGKQRQRRRVMRAVRRHVGGRVKTTPGYGVFQRGEDVGNAMLIGKGFCAQRVDVDGAHQLHPVDRREMFGMVVGHAAGSKNEKTHGGPQR
jgi:hypothetical protein